MESLVNLCRLVVESGGGVRLENKIPQMLCVGTFTAFAGYVTGYVVNGQAPWGLWFKRPFLCLWATCTSFSGRALTVVA